MTSHLLCLGGSVKGYESIVSPFEAVKMEEEVSQGGKEIIRIIAFIDILICWDCRSLLLNIKTNLPFFFNLFSLGIRVASKVGTDSFYLKLGRAAGS